MVIAVLTGPVAEGDRGDCWGVMTETISREFLRLVFGTENDDGDDENAERPTYFLMKAVERDEIVSEAMKFKTADMISC